MYNYNMVQVPPTIEIGRKERGTEAAEYLQVVVQEEAQSGWEFYRIDSIGVRRPPGCLAALSGKKGEEFIYYVITFRRPADQS